MEEARLTKNKRGNTSMAAADKVKVTIEMRLVPAKSGPSFGDTLIALSAKIDEFLRERGVERKGDMLIRREEAWAVPD